MRNSLISLLFLISTFVNASFPTPEGLLRNPNNQEITGNVIVMHFYINAKQVESLELIKKDEVLIEEEKDKRVHLKIIAEKIEKDYRWLEIYYKDGKMRDEDNYKVNYLSSFNNYFQKEQNIEKKLFYATLMMMTFNESFYISKALENYNIKIEKNSELINEERKKLFDSYKKYLIAIKDDKEILEQLENPLKPTDEQAKAQVNEILNQNYYKKSSYIYLERVANESNWIMQYDGYRSVHSLETLRVKELNITTLTKTINLYFDDYILFNGSHEFPKIFLINGLEESQYNIRLTKLDHFEIKNYDIVRRYEQIKKSTLKEEQKVYLPSFLSVN